MPIHGGEMMQSRSQKIAQQAFQCISDHVNAQPGDGIKKPNKDFVSTVKRFPALIHTCGLAQAVAFALAKKDIEFVSYLASILKAAGYTELSDHSHLDEYARKKSLGEYLRVSRDAICAAGWLQRYVEAAGENE
jgi:CRISPR-associated protein Cmr5